MFLACSLCVHCMFIACSLCVPCMFVRCMFPVCSLHVCYVFCCVCAVCFLHVRYVFLMLVVCSLCVHYMFLPCSLCVHYMFLARFLGTWGALVGYWAVGTHRHDPPPPPTHTGPRHSAEHGPTRDMSAAAAGGATGVIPSPGGTRDPGASLR